MIGTISAVAIVMRREVNRDEATYLLLCFIKHSGSPIMCRSIVLTRSTGILLIFIVALGLWGSSEAKLGAETIGSPAATDATFTDGSFGGVYIWNGSPIFTTAGVASSFEFRNFSNGRAVTPLLFEKSGGTFTLRGIGDEVVSAGAPSTQSGLFSLIAGSAAVGNDYTFGFYDGLVSSNGLGGITLGTKNQGSVQADANGDWAFTGGGTPISGLEPNTTIFSIANAQGGSGTLADPYKLYNFESGNGRTYRMNMTSTVPEPSSIVIAVLAAAGIAVGRLWKGRGSSFSN
jgi:hypothetical protein